MEWNTEIELLERTGVILIVIMFRLAYTTAHLKDGLGDLQRIMSMGTTRFTSTDYTHSAEHSPGLLKIH